MWPGLVVQLGRAVGPENSVVFGDSGSHMYMYCTQWGGAKDGVVT